MSVVMLNLRGRRHLPECPMLPARSLARLKSAALRDDAAVRGANAGWNAAAIRGPRAGLRDDAFDWRTRGR
jgi:hypothetical protein